MFVISAEGGGDEQLSEAGIQLKYAFGVAGHNRRLRRRNDKGYALGFNDADGVLSVTHRATNHWNTMKTHITKIALLLLLALGQTACTVNLPGSFFVGPFEKQIVLLRSAVFENNYATAERYIATGVNINAHFEYGFTALHFAAFADSDKVATAFLANGANVDAKGEENFTPLMLALLENANKVAALLLAHGADVNFQAENGFTPLFLAVASGLEGSEEVENRVTTTDEIVALLLIYGADVNAKITGTKSEYADLSGFTPLHIAAVSNNAKVVTMLIEHGAEVNAETDDGTTPLAFAIEEDAQQAVKILRAHGAK